jgi:hypothetical protein
MVMGGVLRCVLLSVWSHAGVFVCLFCLFCFVCFWAGTEGYLLLSVRGAYYGLLPHKTVRS